MGKHIRFQHTLNNQLWLETHYVTKGLDSTQIGELLDCAPTTVVRALKHFGIPIRSVSDRRGNFERGRVKETPQPTEKYIATLGNDDWLEAQWLTSFDPKKIGTLAPAPLTTVNRYLANLFKSRPHLPRFKPTKDPSKRALKSSVNWDNDNWLRWNWLETFSFGALSRRCGASKPTISKRMKELFEKDPSIPQTAPEGFIPLTHGQTVKNEDWLKSAWLELQNISRVAERAGVSPGYVHGYLKKLLEKYPELPKPMTTAERKRASEG